MNYVPQPIDTNHIRLEVGIEKWIEKLAENTHDTWARMRLAEGWTHGARYDDRAKTTPNLVPYEELPETEKDYDRATAREALKLVTALRPVIDVAAVVISCQGQILMGFSPKWGAFTLPMTKRRSWVDGNSTKGAVQEEDWQDAATRAAAKWLGQTLTVEPDFLIEVPEFQQSDRDGSWRRYHLRAFELKLERMPSAPSGRIIEWLSADQIIDNDRKPLSATARHIVEEMQPKGLA